MVYTTHLWIFMVHLGMVYYCCTYIRIIRCFCLRVLIHQTRGFLRKSPRSMGISTYSHSLVTKHQTSSNFDRCKSYLPSGKHTKNDGKIPHFSWDESLFQWWFSVKSPWHHSAIFMASPVNCCWFITSFRMDRSWLPQSLVNS